MMTRIALIFTLLLVGIFSGAEVSAVSASAEEQRRDYLAALEALKKRDIERFHVLFGKLDGYVLRSYLHYEFLKDRLGVAGPEAIRLFLSANEDSPLADILRQKWLRHLADSGDWKIFTEEYREFLDDTELRCLYLGRQLDDSEKLAASMDEIGELWLTGKRLPAACESLFAAWKKAGHLTSERAWERIRLAMENRNLSLANDLAPLLPAKERVWVGRWQDMHRDPARAFDGIRYATDSAIARRILKYGVVRLAYRDPSEAARRWQRLKEEYPDAGFSNDDENEVRRYIGLLAAQGHLPEALVWISEVTPQRSDMTLRLWQIKAALRVGEWDAAQRFIAALPGEQRLTSRWRYWSARILEARGDARVARPLYQQLARERDYYGFLAADRLGLDYAMHHIAIAVKPDELSAMLARPGVRVAQELFALGQLADARRQWNWIIRDMSNRELQVAAVMAHGWGWYDRAIQTVALSDHQDDLELRFPLIYRDMVQDNADRYGIDPGWIYGVMRQESAFAVDARSQAGALGLMQLMPATGRQTSRKMKLNIRGSQALLNVENNLRLGASYLKDMLERNNSNQVLATASYNAGPHRAREWRPADGPLDADIWIETIPYSETRGYVKNVLAFSAVYEHRLGRRPTRLSTRMPPVPPRS